MRVEGWSSQQGFTNSERSRAGTPGTGKKQEPVSSEKKREVFVGPSRHRSYHVTRPIFLLRAVIGASMSEDQPR